MAVDTYKWEITELEDGYSLGTVPRYNPLSFSRSPFNLAIVFTKVLADLVSEPWSPSCIDK